MEKRKLRNSLRINRRKTIIFHLCEFRPPLKWQDTFAIANIVFVPRRKSTKPALLVELKWNKDATSAIQQIKEKNYPASLEEYKDNMLLVGINYDKENKNHTCMIENL